MPGITDAAQESDDTVVYAIELPRSEWDQWKDTVPRSVPLHERLRDLVLEDYRSTAAGGYSEMEERTARLLASRMKRRSLTARQALDRYEDPDDGDPDPERLDSVREHLEAIGEIASNFES